VTGAGIEPAARALKVRCSTTELPGREERRRASDTCVREFSRRVREFSREAGHCTTLKRAEISVFSHDITIDPPPLGYWTIAKVRTSTGVERSRF
jgi:hypothetical protein